MHEIVHVYNGEVAMRISGGGGGLQNFRPQMYEDQTQIDTGNKRGASGRIVGHPSNQVIKRKCDRGRETVKEWVTNNGVREPVCYLGHADRYDNDEEYRVQMIHGGTPRDLYMKVPRNPYPSPKERQYGPFKRVHCEYHLASKDAPYEYDE